MRNPIDLTRAFKRDEDGTILWVGRSDHAKRPQIAIELARRLPSAKFLLVMNQNDVNVHRDIEAAAAQLPNVTIETFVPADRIEALFARAAIFLNTSQFEGFPNAFLQAAKYEVPIASLSVDPDGMLAKYGAGVTTSGDLDGLTDELRRLLSDPGRRRAMGASGLAYVRQNHDQEKAFAILESVILRVAATASRASRRR